MIEIRGDEALIRDFGTAALMVGARAHELVKDAADKTVERAKEHAPKRRPQLAPSITSEMVGPLEAEIGPENALGGGYGHIVEKGLAGRPPQPYLSPALDDVEPMIDRDGDRLLRGLL